MIQKISLTSQMAAIEAAASGASFQPRSNAEEIHRGHLQAALATLRWMKANEAGIRAYLEHSKGGRP